MRSVLRYQPDFLIGPKNSTDSKSASCKASLKKMLLSDSPLFLNIYLIWQMFYSKRKYEMVSNLVEFQQKMPGKHRKHGSGKGSQLFAVLASILYTKDLENRKNNNICLDVVIHGRVCLV